MLAFTAILLDNAPADVVPSALQALFYPLCEGIVVGLILGGAILFVMSAIERLLTRQTNSQPTNTQVAESRPAKFRQQAPRPTLAPRSVKARMEQYPTPMQRPIPAR